MRSDILDPRFAEVVGLDGIGRALAKPLHRVGLIRLRFPARPRPAAVGA